MRLKNHKISRERGIELFTNEVSHFVNLGGVDVHYRDEGEGFPVLLIHGLGASLHNWDKMTTYLKKHYRVIRLDLPGFGLSGYDEKLKGAEDLADIVKGLVDHLGIKKMHLVGSSMGGWVSWEFAYKYGDLLEKMVLIGSAGFFQGDVKSPIYAITQRPRMKEFLQNGVPRILVALVLRRQFHDKKRLSSQFINKYYKMVNIEGNVAKLFAIAQNELKSNPEKLREITVPTLLIWGATDTTMPVKYAYEFKERLVNSELEIYEDAGHIPMEEHPHRTFADIFSFFMR